MVIRKFHICGIKCGLLALIFVSLLGCSQQDARGSLIAAATPGNWDIGVNEAIGTTRTPFQPVETASVATTLSPADESVLGSDESKYRLWIEDYIPHRLEEAITYADPVARAENFTDANLFLLAGETCDFGANWVFALTAAFPTVRDSVKFSDLMNAWQGEPVNGFPNPLLMSKSTYDTFSIIWGASAQGAVRILGEDALLGQAWESRSSLAVIPFEALESRWKVIQIDGVSPIDQVFDPAGYPLTIRYCLTGSDEVMDGFGLAHFDLLGLPETNRSSEKMTSVVMTGVTALVRATAHKMETLGMTYPGEKIYDWMIGSDFTHVSNEVAFANDCPYPDPYQSTLQFCSRPEYIELLEYLEIDIIELTGNHIQDWSRAAFMDTLAMYDDRGMQYYAGGLNESEAQEPLLIEHHGNKLAFIGCNIVGPPGAWATSTSSGGANCYDYQWILNQVRALSDEGYLPIVTLQHNEFYSLTKTGPQERDFKPLAAAGAVIVSGSQAHYPNPFGFVEDHFIHYGLGNLFFDQMDAYIAPGIQREFLDRHIFYDGRYICTEILTAHLEDFAQPRPMTVQEREAFLSEAFRQSGW